MDTTLNTKKSSSFIATKGTQMPVFIHRKTNARVESNSPTIQTELKNSGFYQESEEAPQFDLGGILPQAATHVTATEPEQIYTINEIENGETDYGYTEED